MRSFVIFLVFAGLGAAYLWQQHSDTPPAPVAANAAHLPAAPSATVSEHNWMKHSLDRAAEVKVKAQQQTREAQDP